MKYLKQRNPLGTLQKDGVTVLITTDFGDDIEKLTASLITNVLTITPADLTALIASLSAMQTDLAALLLRVATLEAEVDTLKKGYQS